MDEKIKRAIKDASENLTEDTVERLARSLVRSGYGNTHDNIEVLEEMVAWYTRELKKLASSVETMMRVYAGEGPQGINRFFGVEVVCKILFLNSPHLNFTMQLHRGSLRAGWLTGSDPSKVSEKTLYEKLIKPALESIGFLEGSYAGSWG